MILTADALAFDMDGTLIDSSPVITGAWTQWALRRGLDHAEVVDFSHGRPLHATIARFAPDTDPGPEARWVLDLLPALEHLLRPVAGAAELLACLRDDDWALVTSARRDLALRWMAVCDLPVPRVMITADDVSRAKPDPQPFARAAAHLGHAPDRMIAFEDSAAGLASAQAAGMPSIGIGGATGAVASIPDYTRLGRRAGPRIILSLPGAG